MNSHAGSLTPWCGARTPARGIPRRAAANYLPVPNASRSIWPVRSMREGRSPDGRLDTKGTIVPKAAREAGTGSLRHGRSAEARGTLVPWSALSDRSRSHRPAFEVATA